VFFLKLICPKFDFLVDRVGVFTVEEVDVFLIGISHVLGLYQFDMRKKRAAF